MEYFVRSYWLKKASKSYWTSWITLFSLGCLPWLHGYTCSSIIKDTTYFDFRTWRNKCGIDWKHYYFWLAFLVPQDAMPDSREEKPSVKPACYRTNMSCKLSHWGNSGKKVTDETNRFRPESGACFTGVLLLHIVASSLQTLEGDKRGIKITRTEAQRGKKVDTK